MLLATVWLLLIPLADGFLAETLDTSGLDVSEECGSCRFAVQMMEKKYGEDFGNCIVDVMEFLCELLQIEANYICKAMASNYRDEAIYVLETAIISPKQVCSILVDNCGTFRDPLTDGWLLNMPGKKPPVVEKKAVSPGRPTMRVLQLTDLHIDKDYTVGSEAQCSTQLALCCRPMEDPDEVTVRMDIKEPAGYWGTNGMCDCPYWFVDNMLSQIAQKHKDIEYIILTGDLESHAVYDYTKEEHVERIKNVSALIKSYFPTTEVYYAIGNHEGVPMDSFAPHYTPSEFHMDWLYDTVADSWSDSIPIDQVKMVKYNGCFMKVIFPGLRIISLNTGYGDNANYFLLVNETDPDGSMSWFVQQLNEAELAGDKVHIIAHIPGGTTEALEAWSINYYNAIVRYENIISGQFFGHVHSEQFYMFYENMTDANSRPVELIYSAPSVTGYSRYNPAYRIRLTDHIEGQLIAPSVTGYSRYNPAYRIRLTDHIEGQLIAEFQQVIDWEEYMFNLTANNQPPMSPTWTTLYSSVLKEYNLTANIPSEWSNLINRMKTDDALFDKFMKNYFRRYPYPAVEKNEILCHLRQAHKSQLLCADLQGATGNLPSEHPSRKTETLTKQQIVKKLEEHTRNEKC